MLAEESSPYAVGFLLWALTTFAAIFALGFLDRYVWIRTSPQLSSAIRFAGLFMIASGGIFAAFQRHLGRMMGYASIIGTGMMILAMSLNSSASVEITFLLVIPRGLELAIWSLSIAAIKQNTESLKFSAVQGIARAYPMATGALVLANLSAIGFPLLAGFPPRLALWEELARQSLGSAFWVLIGILGLLIGAVRTLAIFVIVPENTPWKLNESWTQSIMLGVGVIGLFIVGMFPQLMQPFLTSLPALFEHIGQ
jgi:formate hydrogenlyase subunit 3/multisubunit Na+/H+ antiporter MnhD subunit